jgi:CheY-like chemotaxis protein
LSHLADVAATIVVAQGPVMRPMRADRSPAHNEAMACPPSPFGAPVAATDPSRTTGLVSHRAQRRIRVLVVDDDARVRVALGQTIANEADLVMAADAADATAALASADYASPSVALVDVLVPDDTTGLALVRSLSQRPGCAVVAMSVHGGLRRAALAAGAVAFVEKGGDIDAVLDAIRAAAPPHAV